MNKWLWIGMALVVAASPARAALIQVDAQGTISSLPAGGFLEFGLGDAYNLSFTYDTDQPFDVADTVRGYLISDFSLQLGALSVVADLGQLVVRNDDTSQNAAQFRDSYFAGVVDPGAVLTDAVTGSQRAIESIVWGDAALTSVTQAPPDALQSVALLEDFAAAFGTLATLTIFGEGQSVVAQGGSTGAFAPIAVSEPGLALIVLLGALLMVGRRAERR